MKSEIYLSNGADLQDAIDWCIKSTTKQYGIVLSAGSTFSISSPLVIDNAHGLWIRGETPAFPSQGIPAASIETTFNNAPAFAVQGSRACHFQDFEIKGQADFAPLGIPDFDQLIDDSFFVVAGARQNRYSPHCGFVIDPFFDGDPGGDPANRYPGLESHYSGVHQVSSYCTWSGVHPRGFVAAFVNSPSGSGTRLNSENHRFHRCIGTNVGSFYASGQHQTKDVILDQCSLFGGQYFVDCRRYGMQLGYPPIVNGGSVGACQRIFNIHSGYPVSVSDLFVESTLSIGTLGATSTGIPAVASFRGCQMTFWTPQTREQVDSHLFNFIPTSFEGCLLFCTNPSSGDNLLRVYNRAPVSLRNTQLGYSTDQDKVQFSFHDPSLVSGENVTYYNPNAGVVYKTFSSLSDDAVSVGSAVVTYAGTHTATFTLPNHGLTVGDRVFSTTPISTWFPRAHLDVSGQNGNSIYTSDMAVGVVDGVAGDVVTLRRVPEGLKALMPLSITMERRTAQFVV